MTEVLLEQIRGVTLSGFHRVDDGETQYILLYTNLGLLRIRLDGSKIIETDFSWKVKSLGFIADRLLDSFSGLIINKVHLWGNRIVIRFSRERNLSINLETGNCREIDQERLEDIHSEYDLTH